MHIRYANCDNLIWFFALIFLGGETADGEPLFVGRAHHDGGLQLGKVQPSHGVCYIPYGGQEIAYNSYEVLTC